MLQEIAIPIKQITNKKIIASNLPPFEVLKSFIATAVMLSYYGLEYEVVELMMKLNHETRSYLKAQRKVLEGFLVSITNLVKFGPGPKEWTSF